MRATPLVVLALLAPALAAAQPTPAADAADPWWRTTMLDADGDGLHDALATLTDDAPLRVIVDYAHIPTPEQRAALEDAGYVVTHAYVHFPMLGVETTPAAIPRLLTMPGVVFVEADDVLVPLLKDSVPLIGAPQAWASYGATGQGIVVAVLDDGAFEDHPDLRSKVSASYNAAAPASPFGGSPLSGVVYPAGENGHGTHVAGTIVGSGGQSGGVYKGVAPDATFVDVQVFSAPNQTSSTIVLNGLDWVLANAGSLGIRIASISLGGSQSDGTDAISRGVDIAVDEGLVVVAAAGNAGPKAKTITTPGAAEKAITVGAVDKQKRIAPFSSRGPTLDGRTKPDLVAPGSQITSTIPPASTTTATSFLTGGNRQVFYGPLSGTSMAAPHVSGVVALMLEVNPDLAPTDVKRILLATAQDLGPGGKDNDTGFGFVNAVAAVQVARDPTILQSARFADVLAAIPDPPRESFLERAEYELDSIARSGKLPIYIGAGIAVVAVAIIAGALIARRAR